MLVLSRKQNESIFIDDRVVVTVLRVRGRQAVLGIQAPIEVSVQREELRSSMGEAELPKGLIEGLKNRPGR